MTGEELRERIALAMDSHIPSGLLVARDIAAAIVEALGVTREDVDTLRGWAHSGMHDRGVGDPDWKDCDTGCDALTTLLDAAEEDDG